jgi:hypothetical protein
LEGRTLHRSDTRNNLSQLFAVDGLRPTMRFVTPLAVILVAIEVMERD